MVGRYVRIDEGENGYENTDGSGDKLAVLGRDRSAPRGCVHLLAHRADPQDVQQQ
jgi:hypothetical protein